MALPGCDACPRGTLGRGQKPPFVCQNPWPLASSGSHPEEGREALAPLRCQIPLVSYVCSRNRVFGAERAPCFRVSAEAAPSPLQQGAVMTWPPRASGLREHRQRSSASLSCRWCKKTMVPWTTGRLKGRGPSAIQTPCTPTSQFLPLS